MAYARITLAVSDQCPGGLEGFAPLSGHLPAALFDSTIADGQDMTKSAATHCVWLDLMDGEHSRVDEKCISLTTAARILDVEPETLVPLGRQRLAQANDEAANYLRQRHGARTQDKETA